MKAVAIFARGRKVAGPKTRWKRAFVPSKPKASTGASPIAPSFRGYSSASPAASRVKQRNRKTGGIAELTLRRLLWAPGLRYRLGGAGLPAKPDLVFPRCRLVVFVDGDFWHGRDWEKRVERLAKGSNSGYWVEKIAYNRERDLRNNALLEASGWRVLRLWETDLLEDPSGAAHRVCPMLRTGLEKEGDNSACRDGSLSV